MEDRNILTHSKPDLTIERMSDSSDSDTEDDELYGEQSDDIYFSPNEDEDGHYERVCAIVPWFTLVERK